MEPLGWREYGFDDSSWPAPLTGWQDHGFVKADTQPLQIWRADPVLVKEKEPGHYFYDFGTELTGHTRIRIKGPEGHALEVRHGEELEGPDTVRYQLRATCTYQEFPILSGNDDTIEFFDYKGFRYIEILNAPAKPEVWAMVRHYPFNPEASKFNASEPILESIWALCRNGVMLGAQGGFVDCPTREKGQYLGDTLIASHSHLYLTGDPSLSRKAIRDFQLSQRLDPGIMGVAPCSYMQEFAEYSLQWTLLLRNYYLYTDDRFFTYRMADEAFDKLYSHFAAFEDEDGLLSDFRGKTILVDWPPETRDGYDFGTPGANAVLNAWYYASLKAAAEICRAVELDGAEDYEARAERVRQAFVARLLDPASGLFVDAPGSKHSSLHTNALPLAFGMVPDENKPQIIALIREKRLNCGVYIAPFVIEACYAAGEPELAYNLLMSEDEHSWQEMIRHGATACMEVWGPDQKQNTSWCHPWSSSPIYLIAEQVAGLTPAKPGWKAIRFEPHMPTSLTRMELDIPTPVGKVALQYAQDKGYTLIVPPGVPVDNAAPAQTPVHIEQRVENGFGRLTEGQAALLAAKQWESRVGQAEGVWVSVKEQKMRLLKGRNIVWEAPCSTAAKGVGSKMGSMMTPEGWHVVSKKLGDGLPWGQVFRSRAPTAERWQPGMDAKEDLVLTRVLLLDGEEPGLNKGGDVDSAERFIYIHGTNGEENIGTPSSHGCIRLRNNDVLTAFSRIPEGAPVLITAG